MNKTVVGVVVTILAVVGIVGVVALNNNEDNPSSVANDTQHSGSAQKDGATPQNNNPLTQNNDVSVGDVQSGTVEMDIKDFAFAQKTLKIKKGTTVVWTNRDDAGHDITPEPESEAFKKSKLLSQGETYSFTFDTAGSYKYKCSPHPYMKGTVEVVE